MNFPDQTTRCTEICDACHRVCLHTAARHSLSLGGPETASRHLRVLFACADICRLAADFQLAGTDYHRHLCGVCAEVCEACVAQCTELNIDGMEECLETCRHCAEACRELAAETVAA